MENTAIKKISRRSMLQFALTGTAVTALAVVYYQKDVIAGNTAQTITVWKTPTCGCCKAWVEHLRKNGFDVVTNDVSDTSPIRSKLGLPEQYGSCHTAKLGDYVLEGHVPAEDIRKLLMEKPVARGLAVPGMPLGSPGMEGTGRFAGMQDAFDVLLVLNDGNARVFKSYASMPASKS